MLDLYQSSMGRGEAAQRPFDLARGPLLRVRLLRLAPEEHVLLLLLHHFVTDGWSTRILMRELGPLYEAFSEGKPSPLPALPMQFVDFAQWQRECVQEGSLNTQLVYWTNQLNNVPITLALPTDRPRLPVKTYRGAVRSFVLSPALLRAPQDLSRRENATLFMTLMAAWQTLLYRYTAQDTLVVATAVANRTRLETESLIGPLVNTLLWSQEHLLHVVQNWIQENTAINGVG